MADKPLVITAESYLAAIEPCLRLSLDRSKKYGDAWSGARLTSLTDYVIMKYRRLNTMTADTQANRDKIRSDLHDAINYGVMALIMLNEQEKEK